MCIQGPPHAGKLKIGDPTFLVCEDQGAAILMVLQLLMLVHAETQQYRCWYKLKNEEWAANAILKIIGFRVVDAVADGERRLWQLTELKHSL